MDCLKKNIDKLSQQQQTLQLHWRDDKELKDFVVTSDQYPTTSSHAKPNLLSSSSSNTQQERAAVVNARSSLITTHAPIHSNYHSSPHRSMIMVGGGSLLSHVKNAHSASQSVKSPQTHAESIAIPSPSSKGGSVQALPSPTSSASIPSILAPSSSSAASVQSIVEGWLTVGIQLEWGKYARMRVSSVLLHYCTYACFISVYRNKKALPLNGIGSILF